MLFFLAAFPILVLLLLMLLFRWSGPRAGLAGWAAAVAVGVFAFGLTPQVFWVSQVKGLLLSFFVLAIFWPALYLYNVVQQAGGIRAMARGMEQAVGDPGILTVVLAWAFSGLLEGLAGFGLPIAVVAPMLAGLGVNPVTAVAAVAIGHAWSVTFGDMGVIFQTLIGVVHMDPVQLVPITALLLGAACLACGLAAAFLLGQIRRWPLVVGLGLVMAGVQYGLAAGGLTQLAAFGAGLSGVCGAVAYGLIKRRIGVRPQRPRDPDPIDPARPPRDVSSRREMVSVVSSYGVLTLVMTVLALPGPIRSSLYPYAWQLTFPEVTTRLGHVTQAGAGQAFRVFVHPGTAILVVAGVSVWLFARLGFSAAGSWRSAARATWHSAVPASLGVIATVGLSALMEHTGMTLLLAQGLSRWMGNLFPLISPWVGILGAFASGSNNNSNVLFGMLQKNAALLLGIAPALLVAAQTAGGSLGSMLAPAKIVVGCSTVGIKGMEGQVLKKTLPFGLAIGLLVGLVALALAALLPGG